MNLHKPRSAQRIAGGIACVLIATLALGAGTAKKKPQTEKLDFNRDVRSIISKCFTCHGSDPGQRQAGLRLDMAKVAYETGAIVPGKPDKSELIYRIFAKDNVSRMPPVSSGKVLTEAEKQTLKRWIEEGAEYKEHWAFIPPKRPALPAVRQKSWPKNGIDNFILERLERAGFRPSPPADKPTLIRRVTLDLIGLPPTPAEVNAFLSDSSPRAYEKVVDRLLARKEYGERMAQIWLDGARYADSNGYQADFERYQWRWRDWVIEAFNTNMPFDQFTLEQIAGDMLPNATLSQRIASGFNRNHRINTEGGVIPEEWRVETVIDRVETTSEVWLGLTSGCARCHSHKYDPISQKEFYGLYAYFNNVPESGSGPEIPVNHPPLVKAPTGEQATRLAELDSGIKDRIAKLNERLAANHAASEKWKLDEVIAEEEPLQSGVTARYALSSTPRVAAGTAPPPVIKGEIRSDAGTATGALVTSGGSFVDLGTVGDFDRADHFSVGVFINPEGGNGAAVSRMDSNADFRGWDIYYYNSRIMIHLIHKWSENALKIISKSDVPANQWTHVMFTYDGSAKPEGLKLYLNGRPAEVTVEVNSLRDTIKTGVTAKLASRTGSEPFPGKLDDLVLYGRTLPAEQVSLLASLGPVKSALSVPVEARTEEQKKRINELWSERHDSAYQLLTAEKRDLSAKYTQLDNEISSVMIMEDMKRQRDCFVLVRGQYDKPGDRVFARIPAAFPPLPKGAPNNRLGLALWIIDPGNPLTARVAVNRYWEKFFGAGIVATSEDLGTRAEFPSHPELLDWLATEFIRLGWDMKAMQKKIVMSATYQQSSRVTPEIEKIDPTNRLLAHAPRLRLQAEQIRDQALAASGLLVEKIGGPSVRPYQPAGIWDELNVYGNLRNYMADKGDGLYRRSIYTIWKRTAAPPMMTLFDVPGRETCRVRRSRTNTPLQALILLNEETFVEASRKIAERMILEGGATPEQRIDYAYMLMLSRHASPQEMQIIADGFRGILDHYRANADSAEKLIGIGASPADPNLDKVELAAYTITANTILNLDEAITRE